MRCLVPFSGPGLGAVFSVLSAACFWLAASAWVALVLFGPVRVAVASGSAWPRAEAWLAAGHCWVGGLFLAVCARRWRGSPS